MKIVASVLLSWILIALFGSWIADEPNSVDLSQILSPPSFSAGLGFDDLGRPIFDRLIVGGQVSLTVSVLVVSISMIVGVLIGLVGAYFGGWVDRFLILITDTVLAFPGLLLAIALAGVLGPSLSNVVIALCLVSWVGYARLTRAQVLSIKQREHVQAAVALGIGRRSILLRHILPLALAPIIVEASFGIASVVIAEAGLSFLGLGVQPPEASWGNMIRDGARYLLVAPHMVLLPSLALLTVVMAVNLFGDYLRDYFDVRRVVR